jgi:hypothetical protein
MLVLRIAQIFDRLHYSKPSHSHQALHFARLPLVSKGVDPKPNQGLAGSSIPPMFIEPVTTHMAMTTEPEFVYLGSIHVS